MREEGSGLDGQSMINLWTDRQLCHESTQRLPRDHWLMSWFLSSNDTPGQHPWAWPAPPTVTLDSECDPECDLVCLRDEASRGHLEPGREIRCPVPALSVPAAPAPAPRGRQMSHHCQPGLPESRGRGRGDRDPWGFY